MFGGGVPGSLLQSRPKCALGFAPPPTARGRLAAGKRTADRLPTFHGVAIGTFMRWTLGTPVHQLIRIRERGFAGFQAHYPCKCVTY
jgi:hypothetical protein